MRQSLNWCFKFYVGLVFLFTGNLQICFANGFPEKEDSLRFEILLTPTLLSEFQVNDDFINAMEITSSRNILLASKNQFYVLGWGGMISLGGKSQGNIESFAFTYDSLLLIIKKNEICYFDSSNNLNKLFELPREGMGISTGKFVFYVFDKQKGNAQCALFVIAEGGKYLKLFDIPTPINAVVEWDNKVLFSTENSLFQYDIKRKEIKKLAYLPKGTEINSIAIDALYRRIFYSTATAIYSFADTNGVLITDKFGGLLRYFDDGLLVYNSTEKTLIRIIGLENVISQNKYLTVANNKSTSKEIVTNNEIINMVMAKLSDNLIIKLIDSSEVNFDVSVDAMIFLAEQNVSSAVIMAMRNAMKNSVLPTNKE